MKEKLRNENLEEIKEIMEAEIEIKTKEEEIGILKSELHAAEAKKKLEHDSKLLTLAQKEIDEKKSQLEKALEEKDKMVEKNVASKNELKDKLEKAIKSEIDRYKLSDEIESERSEIARLREGVENLQKEIERMQERLQELTEQMKDGQKIDQSKIDSLVSLIKSDKNRIEMYNEKINTFDNYIILDDSNRDEYKELVGLETRVSCSNLQDFFKDKIVTEKEKETEEVVEETKEEELLTKEELELLLGKKELEKEDDEVEPEEVEPEEVEPEELESDEVEPAELEPNEIDRMIAEYKEKRDAIWRNVVSQEDGATKEEQEKILEYDRLINELLGSKKTEKGTKYQGTEPLNPAVEGKALETKKETRLEKIANFLPIRLIIGLGKWIAGTRIAKFIGRIFKGAGKIVTYPVTKLRDIIKEPIQSEDEIDEALEPNKIEANEEKNNPIEDAIKNGAVKPKEDILDKKNRISQDLENAINSGVSIEDINNMLALEDAKGKYFYGGRKKSVSC